MAKTVKAMIKNLPDAVVEENEDTDTGQESSDKPIDDPINEDDETEQLLWSSNEPTTSVTAQDIPVTLAAEIAYKAKLKGMSVRGLLLKGLQLQGFEVPEGELRDGRLKR